MAAEEIKNISTEELATELKRRISEIETVKQQLGFGGPTITTNRSRATGKSLMSKAADKRWAGWEEYKAQHPNAKPKEFWKAKKAGKL